MRLSGWQRIGVILSVIWFIGFAGYIWHADRKEKAAFYVSQLNVCSEIWETENESLKYIQDPKERDKREAANRAKYDQCNDKAEKFYAVQIGDGGWGQWALGWGLLIGVDLLTIGIGGLLAWLTISVARWVRRGFHQASPPNA
jgi:hypothetical protein